MNIEQILSSNLRNLRNLEGLTQEELALKSGVHRTTISGIEQNSCNITVHNLQKLAGALNVTAADLLTPHEYPNARESLLEYSKRMKGIGSDGIHYALCKWVDGQIDEIDDLDTSCPDLTFRIVCALAEDHEYEDIPKIYGKVEESVMRYVKSFKKSEYPSDIFSESDFMNE